MTLVLRLFLRRLVDNDVISPNADRHESLAVLCALVCPRVFLVPHVGILSAFIQLRGRPLSAGQSLSSFRCRSP